MSASTSGGGPSRHEAPAEVKPTGQVVGTAACEDLRQSKSPRTKSNTGAQPTGPTQERVVWLENTKVSMGQTAAGGSGGAHTGTGPAAGHIAPAPLGSGAHWARA